MKVTEKYTIELLFEEALALKILLGKFSDTDKMGIGLNEKQIESMRELYYRLPDDYQE